MSKDSWFAHDRFGLFIHWGIFAMPARHEWVKTREEISDEDYQIYFDHFDPDLYDPSVWAREAKNAGMKYFVITTKHHDGFCLWDSTLTDYKAPNTPAERDLLRPMVNAFRAEGLKIGLYHSVIDWRHPEFPVDGLHPMRGGFLDSDAVQDPYVLPKYPLDGLHPEREKGAQNEVDQERNICKYAEYLHGQTRELLTGFGQIDVLWYDFSYSDRDWGWSRGKGKNDWGSEKLMAMVRELQPNILVNDRLEVSGDFVTPQQYQPDSPLMQDGKPVLWEACQTFNGSWGYDRDNLDWKPVVTLLRMLIDTVSKDGNLLLNVGPNARGEFEPHAIDRLRSMGQWMRLHGRSIYGCGSSRFTPPPDCRYTQNGNRLYLHLFAWPYRHAHLSDLGGKVAYAQLLNDASEITMHTTDPTQVAQDITMGGLQLNTLTLDLPVQKPDVIVPVVELFLK